MLLRYADRAGVGGIAPPPHQFTPPPRFERRFHVFGYVRKPAPLRCTHYARVVDQLGSGDERPAQGRERLLQGGEGRRRQTLHQPVAPLKDGEGGAPALARVAVANAVCVGSLQQAPPSAGAVTSRGPPTHFPCVAFK